MKILVTGIAGFIGHRVALTLANAGNEVVGVDYLNNGRYDQWQQGRLGTCGINLIGQVKKGGRIGSVKFPNLRLDVINIENKNVLDHLFAVENFDIVIHLAAKAGVRDSIKSPYSYFRTNSLGFFNVIDACRKYNVRYLFFASSSSVYGKYNELPLKENDITDSYESFYAVTKASNESIAKYYARAYNMYCIGMRFFSVYGPWGRPDMAPMIFSNAILKKHFVPIFGNGELARDFTYIDDVVSAIDGIIRYVFSKESIEKDGIYDVFNIGTGKTVKVCDFLTLLENEMQISAQRQFLPAQRGDMDQTMADVSKLKEYTGCECKKSLEYGITAFVDWFILYHVVITKEIIANKFRLDLDSIKLQDNFITNYHADSLDLLDLIFRVEQRFEVKIPNEQIKQIFTVEDLLKALNLFNNRV